MAHAKWLVPALLLLGSAGCSQPVERWDPATRYSYGVHMTTEALAQGKDPMFDFDLHGRLVVTPVQAKDDRSFTLVLSFAEASFSTKKKVPAVEERFRVVAAELGKSHTFEFKDGHQISGTFFKGEQATTVAVLRNIAAAFQQPMQAEGGGPWQAREYDATGRYLADYARIAGEDRREQKLKRRKVRYEQLIASDRVRSALFDSRAPLPELTESTATQTLRGEVVQGVQSSESISAELIASSTLVTKTRLEMNLKDRAKGSAVPASQGTSELLVLKAEEPYVDASGVFDLDETKIGGRTLEEVISAGEAQAVRQKDDGGKVMASRNGVAAAPEDVAEGKDEVMRDTRLYLALSAILRKDDGAAVKAEAYLRGGSTASQLIISSLAAAGTEASQRVLRTVWEDERFSLEQRKAATFALIRTKNPSVASAEFLQARLDDERRHDFAEMGLGIFVRLFGESGQTDLQKRFADALIGHLTTAQTSVAREGALLGLSNAGYDPALPVVQKYLNDSDVKVRSAAVQSLRLMKTQKVDGLILHALGHDAEPDVRRNALQALNNRPYQDELGRAAGDCLSKDQDPKVRLTALSLLASWARTNPELLAPIRKAAAEDANFMVKKEAGVVAARLSALAAATPAMDTNP